MPVHTLSVSPIGSSPLQQRGEGELLRVTTTFSIPNRIEPSATLEVATGIKKYFTFSIPNRIEPSATS